jgi:hypothetical protein
MNRSSNAISLTNGATSKLALRACMLLQESATALPAGSQNQSSYARQNAVSAAYVDKAIMLSS